MSNLHLYEIADEYRNLLEIASDPESDDLDMESFEAAIAALEGQFQTKAVNIACLIREWEAESNAISQVIAAQLQRAKSIDGKAKRLRDYLLTQMEVSSLPAIRDARIAVKLRKNPPSVQIETPASIPDMYCRHIPARIEPDKQAIKEAMKAGGVVPGASLIQTTRLEIK